jgi:hypothetical protein
VTLQIPNQNRSDAGWNKTDGAAVSNGMAAANLPTDLERRSLPGRRLVSA